MIKRDKDEENFLYKQTNSEIESEKSDGSPGRRLNAMTLLQNFRH